MPFFEGKREDFADFSYKLRAVLLEHNIDDIIFNPTAADFSYKLRAVILEHSIDIIVFNPTAISLPCQLSGTLTLTLIKLAHMYY